MNTLFMVLSLLVGDLDESSHAIDVRPIQQMQLSKAPRTNVNDLANWQIVEIYPTPAGWDPIQWAEAVRTIDPSSAGRR